MDNFKILHSDNWYKASWQEKLETLQKLENLQAIQQGRNHRLWLQRRLQSQNGKNT